MRVPLLCLVSALAAPFCAALLQPSVNNCYKSGRPNVLLGTKANEIVHGSHQQSEQSSPSLVPSCRRRRQALLSIPFLMLTTAISVKVPEAKAAAAEAAATGLSPEEKHRIAVGYQQVEYLINNFDQETTVCRDNGGECKRDADAVRRALGLRSTTDPLFQIDKVLAKVKNMDLDVDQLEAFFDASEDFNSALNLSNSMAFVSQFGEYNPGGGKDEVLKYLIESKKQVLIVQKALKTIMEILDIPPIA